MIEEIKEQGIKEQRINKKPGIDLHEAHAACDQIKEQRIN